MSLLPLRGEPAPEPDEPRVVGLDGEAADEAFEALSSSTTREVLAALYEEPSAPADLRDRTGTSLQNVHYHLGKLEDADLIEPAGVGYSEKGTEMTVYAPTSEAVVLFAGRREDRSRLRDLLTGLFAVLLALGAASAALRRYLRGSLTAFGGDSGADEASQGGDGGADGDSGGGSGGDDAAGGDARETETVADADATGAGGGDETAAREVEAETEAVDGGDVSVESADTPTETADAAAEATPTATETLARTATEAADGGADAVAGIDPAVAFFLGGVFALAVGALVLYGLR